MTAAGERSYNTLLYANDGGVLTITLNRPDQLNGINDEVADELLDAFDAADGDDGVGVIIVTGAGRAFCAGADLGAGASTFDYAQHEGNASPVRDDGTIDYSHPAVRDKGGILALRMMRCTKPLIGAINGPAVGVGVTLTLPMDIRIAANHARFGFAFARRGVVPEAASTWFLPRIVGISQAADWCVTGRIFPAEEALAKGLLRSLHEPQELLPTAHAIARDIIDNCAPVSVALIRQMLWQGLTVAHPMDAHRVESWSMYERGRSADAFEGITSFLEKRPSRFGMKISDGMPAFYPWWSEPEYH